MIIYNDPVAGNSCERLKPLLHSTSSITSGKLHHRHRHCHCHCHRHRHRHRHLRHVCEVIMNRTPTCIDHQFSGVSNALSAQSCCTVSSNHIFLGQNFVSENENEGEIFLDIRDISWIYQIFLDIRDILRYQRYSWIDIRDIFVVKALKKYSGEYMGHEGRPYCERDYHEKYGVKCAYCQRFISGKVKHYL